MTENLRAIVPVPRLWPGSTIVCAASGPSLTQADLDYVRGKAPVIAVNDAHRLCPWAAVVYSNDRAWWPFYKGLPGFTGLRYGIGSALGKANPFNVRPECPALREIAILKNTGHAGLELDPSGLRSGMNSGYGAVNLAVHLGAARIVLLGYNMGIVGDRSHFFGKHPPGLAEQPWNYQSFRRNFHTMVEPLQAIGVEVINCTDPSALEAFPRGVLRDVLPASSEVAA